MRSFRLNTVRPQRECIKDTFTLYRIDFGPAWKQYRIGLLFSHKNRDFGAVSVTERGCDAPISTVEVVTFRIGVHTEPESFTACTKTIRDSVIIASVFDFNYHSIKIYLFNAFEELEECGDKKNAILLNLGISFCGKITQRTISSKSTSQIILGER